MGTLDGVRIVELGGIGPAPFAAMVLADMGAEIIRVERPAGTLVHRSSLLLRGRVRIRVDLKNPTELEWLLALVDRADVLMEGFRPGVAERLGVGPEVCLER